MKKFILVTLFIILLIAIAGFFLYRNFSQKKSAPKSPPNISPSPVLTTQVSPTLSTNTLSAPIAQFKERITKKPFGIFISPQNSPVSPERFTGYHTGVDVEYEDVTTDVPVLAIADGTIVYANTVNGYGGVAILKFTYQNQEYTALYGHLRPASLPEINKKVSQGEQIAILGTGESPETDGERRHLHFAVTKNNQVNFRGYVQNQGELASWLNPLELY